MTPDSPCTLDGSVRVYRTQYGAVFLYCPFCGNYDETEEP